MIQNVDAKLPLYSIIKVGGVNIFTLTIKFYMAFLKLIKIYYITLSHVDIMNTFTEIELFKGCF